MQNQKRISENGWINQINPACAGKMLSLVRIYFS